MAEVTGNVELDGKPLPGGTLHILVNKEAFSVGIQADGTFRGTGIKAGEAKLRIEPEPKDEAPPPPPPDEGIKDGATPPKETGSQKKHVPIPYDYSDFETSGLTWNIVGGTNNETISIKSDYKFKK